MAKPCSELKPQHDHISFLHMKLFLWSLSPFHWFKMGSCKLLAKNVYMCLISTRTWGYKNNVEFPLNFNGLKQRIKISPNDIMTIKSVLNEIELAELRLVGCFKTYWSSHHYSTYLLNIKSLYSNIYNLKLCLLEHNICTSKVRFLIFLNFSSSWYVFQ